MGQFFLLLVPGQDAFVQTLHVRVARFFKSLPRCPTFFLPVSAEMVLATPPTISVPTAACGTCASGCTGCGIGTCAATLKALGTAALAALLLARPQLLQLARPVGGEDLPRTYSVAQQG